MTSDIKGFRPHCDHSGMGGLPWDRARRIVAERSKDIAIARAAHESRELQG
jgi:hypothetical protein